ncbi:MAG: phage tail tape measure protein, partial [Lachnoclostridium sp.]|nr:phage tail tape measure protein [Lachnoclostridium sp.]
MARVISVALTFIDSFSKPSAQTIKNMQRIGREAQAAGKQIQASGRVMSNAGAAMTKSLTVPIVGVAVAAVKTAADFEEQMTKVKVIAGSTQDDFAQLKEEAKRLGATTKFSAQESAEAMEYMAQAGWGTNDILSGTEGVMNAAASSGENLADVASIMAKNITAFGDKASDASKYADVLASAAAVSAADINYMGEGFKYCASTAGAMNYKVEDMSIALAALSQAGIESGTAGASLRNIISNMAKPTDSQSEVMKKLGLSLTDNSGKT